jgi:hypothetical protein
MISGQSGTNAVTMASCSLRRRRLAFRSLFDCHPSLYSLFGHAASSCQASNSTTRPQRHHQQGACWFLGHVCLRRHAEEGWRAGVECIIICNLYVCMVRWRWGEGGATTTATAAPLVCVSPGAFCLWGSQCFSMHSVVSRLGRVSV